MSITEQTNHDLGFQSDAFPFDQLDTTSKDYWWGWYWFLTGHIDVSFLVKRTDRLINDPVFCEMGFQDAKGSYQRRRMPEWN